MDVIIQPAVRRHRFVCRLCKLLNKCTFTLSDRCSYRTMNLLWVRQGCLKVEEGLEHFKRSLLSRMMQNRLCGNGQRALGIKSKCECALNGLILPEQVLKVCTDSNFKCTRWTQSGTFDRRLVFKIFFFPFSHNKSITTGRPSTFFFGLDFFM